MQNSDKKKTAVVLLGSPRKNGNSAILAQEIVKGAEEIGVSCESLYIHGMNISPCQSCYACQQKDSKGCAIDDDMQIVYPKLVESDAWIIASPVYWFTMSAQTKIWMDRCFALPVYGENAFAKKRIAIAMSYGDKDPFVSGCVNALRTFQDSFGYVGAKIIGAVYGTATDKGEINQNKEVLKMAKDIGKRLIK